MNAEEKSKALRTETEKSQAESPARSTQTTPTTGADQRPSRRSSAEGAPFAYGLARLASWGGQIHEGSQAVIAPGQPVEYAAHCSLVNPDPNAVPKNASECDTDAWPEALLFPYTLMETRAPRRVPMPLQETIARAQRRIDEAMQDTSDDVRKSFLSKHSLLLLSLVPSERVLAIELRDGRLAEVPLPSPDELWALSQPWVNELRPISLMSGIPDGLTSEEALAYLHVASGDTDFTDEWYAKTWAEIRKLLRAGTIGVPDVIATADCTIVADGRDRAGECRAFHELVARNLAEPSWASMEVVLVSSLHRTGRPGPRDTVRDALAWVAPLTELMADSTYYEILWNGVMAEAEMMGIHDPYELDHRNWRRVRAVIRALDSGDVEAARQALDAYERATRWDGSSDGWAARPEDTKDPNASLDWLLTRHAEEDREDMPEGPANPDDPRTMGMPASLWFPEALDRHLPGNEVPTGRELERAVSEAQRNIDEGLEVAGEAVRRRYLASRARLRIVTDNWANLRLVTLEGGRLRLADAGSAAQALNACRSFGLLPEGFPEESVVLRTSQEVLAYCHILSDPLRTDAHAGHVLTDQWGPIAALLRSGKIGAADVFATRGCSEDMAGRDRAAECLAFRRLVADRGLEPERAADVVETIVALHRHAAQARYPLVDEALSWAKLIVQAQQKYPGSFSYDIRYNSDVIDGLRPLPPMDAPEPAPDELRPSYFAAHAQAVLDALASGDEDALAQAIVNWRAESSPVNVARYVRDPDQQAEIEQLVAKAEQRRASQNAECVARSGERPDGTTGAVSPSAGNEEEAAALPQR